MKRYILLSAFATIGIFSATLYSACTKDPCKDVSCKNGGTCKAGSCICPSGYTGSRCETVVQGCVVNNTAIVQFSNRSTGSTYSIVWDGSVMTTLAPGVNSQTYTVAAGAHTLEFKLSNGSTSACTPSTPVLAQCSSMVYWCTY
jgi:hypothetical protein